MGVDAEMFVRTRQPLMPEQVKLLAWEMGEAFGADRFWIFKEFDPPCRALAIVDIYEQDGDDIVPEDGEQFIRVYPSTRYYGKGYERGDLPFLIMLAEWLERRIPSGQVWYGGDSSGICAERFDVSARTALLDHFARVGHFPYSGDPRTGSDQSRIHDDGLRRICNFCEMPMRRYGWGGSTYGAFYCVGCGLDESTHDGGATWKSKEEK